MTAQLNYSLADLFQQLQRYHRAGQAVDLTVSAGPKRFMLLDDELWTNDAATARANKRIQALAPAPITFSFTVDHPTWAHHFVTLVSRPQQPLNFTIKSQAFFDRDQLTGRYSDQHPNLLTLVDLLSKTDLD